jgi:hypothetical protein
MGRLRPIVDGLHAISTNAALSTGASTCKPPFRDFVVITDALCCLPQASPPADIVFSAIGFLLSVRITFTFSGSN